MWLLYAYVNCFVIAIALMYWNHMLYLRSVKNGSFKDIKIGMLALVMFVQPLGLAIIVIDIILSYKNLKMMKEIKNNGKVTNG